MVVVETVFAVVEELDLLDVEEFVEFVKDLGYLYLKKLHLCLYWCC